MSKIANFMGHSGAEVGSVGILREDDVNREATNIATDWFKSKGFTVVTDNNNMSLSTRISVANKNNLVGLIEWHANMGGGTGIEIFYSYHQPSAKKVADKMCASVSHLLRNRGGKISSSTRFGRLGILDDTKVKNAMLVELIFLDSQNDVNVWKKHKKEIVENICYAYCRELGLLKNTSKPKPNPPKPQEPSKGKDWSKDYYTSNPGRVVLRKKDGLYGINDLEFKKGKVTQDYPAGTPFVITGMRYMSNGLPRLVTQSGFLLSANKKIVKQEGSSKPKLTNQQMAEKVYRGEYGNGATRINRLRAEGYDPVAIQALVNKM